MQHVMELCDVVIWMDEGKIRMDKLGYIKNIEGNVADLGGTVLDVIPINNITNPLNPTVCYVIEPPKKDVKHLKAVKFCVPGTNYRLEVDGQFLLSKNTGLVFPILDEIAILKLSSAILATSKC